MRIRIGALLATLLVVVGLVSGLTGAPAAAAGGDGQAVSSRELPASMLPSGAARAVKVRYLTRNQSGQRVEGDGVVYYPHGAAPAGGWKVVSWAHGTSGIAPKCAPSHASGAEHDKSQPNIAAALKRGYVVTAPDYIGMSGTPGTEYLGGKSAGYNVIDMVRAARHTDAAIGRRWASLGHSQGGHAALWATRLADSYAPELRNVGTVAIAPASQIESVIPLIASPATPNIGPLNRTALFALYLLDGLDNSRPELNAGAALTPAGKYWLGRARAECAADLNPKLANIAPGTLFRRSLNDAPLGPALRDYSAIPNYGWQQTRPIRIQQGITDMIVLPPMTAALTAQLLQGGATVNVGTYRGDHTGILRESMTDTYNTIDGYFR
ncbi:MAG: lipase family protein [Gordonia sp. (in: high G+C Gram-positive bacteria)]|uniref:lipase family protein n=1 Tax=Gordonia sp. (in: high G+C Gram-positive bacteria) TaxID=84139 RepID=UPI003BB5B825